MVRGINIATISSYHSYRVIMRKRFCKGVREHANSKTSPMWSNRSAAPVKPLLPCVKHKWGRVSTFNFHFLLMSNVET